MKKFRSLSRWMVAALTVSSLTMCHKREKDDQVAPKAAATSGISSIQAVSACTYSIKPTETVFDASSIPAGSTICLESGMRGALQIKNVKGTAAKPIIIINKGGKVSFNVPGSNSFAFKISGSSFFKLLGTGDANNKYGIDVNGGHIGVSLEGLSTNWEVAGLEVRNSGFAGIMGKTDPSCDVATQRGHFVMHDVSLHDNYVHNVTGEGFYIGNSFYQQGRQEACGTVYPHEIWGCKVFNNRTDQTGCEGIQVGCATKGCEIYNNVVTSPGRSPFANAQDNGIQIGAGTGGTCHNNLVKNTPSNGIICLGTGDNVVYNNIVVNSGANGIFADSRSTPGPYFKFINNTIVNSGADGMRLYSETLPMNYVINNVIIKSGSGKAINKRSANVKVTDLNNYVNNDIAACKFVNPAADNYKLSAGSPLINTGCNVSANGITNDYYCGPRPVGGTFDIGASEYGSAAPTPSNPGTTTPVTSVPKPTPTPAPAPVPTQPAATLIFGSFTLVNAVTNRDIGPISNGSVIDLAKIGTNNLSIRANTNTATKSVVFGYDARPNFRTETGTPFSIMGEMNGKYTPWIPTKGSHTISLTPYGSVNGTGNRGGTHTITVTVK